MIEIPVIESPDILHDLLSESRSMFYRGQYRQFCRNVIASWASPTRSVAHLNGISVEHTNQINLNCFLRNIDTLDIFRKSVELINRFCTDPVLVLDDAVLQKPGRHIDGAGWLYNHNEGKTVRGMSAVTAAVAGNVGYFPLNIDIKLVRKKRRRPMERERQYIMSKIIMRMAVIKRSVTAGLRFHMALFDS